MRGRSLAHASEPRGRGSSRAAVGKTEKLEGGPDFIGFISPMCGPSGAVLCWWRSAARQCVDVRASICQQCGPRRCRYVDWFDWMILVAEVLFALSIFAAISDNVSDPLVPLSSAP